MQQKLSWPHRVICLRPVGTDKAGFLRRPAFSKLSWLGRAPCPDLGGERGTFKPSARWRTRLREGGKGKACPQAHGPPQPVLRQRPPKQPSP